VTARLFAERGYDVALLAISAPQLDQVRSKLPHTPQPVPPIYQPGVAAILAARLVPGLLDHHLGRTGSRSQQTPEPADPTRPDNVWEPVPGDLGAHGGFDRTAHARSHQAWSSAHRRGLALVGVAAAGAAALVRRDGR
jgi:hypothetical protein